MSCFYKFFPLSVRFRSNCFRYRNDTTFLPPQSVNVLFKLGSQLVEIIFLLSSNSEVYMYLLKTGPTESLT